MDQTPPNNPPRARTGSVRARTIQADNIVTGQQIQGADAEAARELLALARQMETGSVEAVQDIIAKNVVTGLQYLGQGGTAPTLQQFRQELAALREQLAQAVQAGEFAQAYDAQDAQTAVARAIEQSQVPQPAAEKITPHLERAVTIINQAAEAANSVGNFQAAVIKLAPIGTALYRLASLIL
jgi:hypothetical protein